jgi:hypothetical protein
VVLTPAEQEVFDQLDFTTTVTPIAQPVLPSVPVALVDSVLTSDVLELSHVLDQSESFALVTDPPAAFEVPDVNRALHIDSGAFDNDDHFGVSVTQIARMDVPPEVQRSIDRAAHIESMTAYMEQGSYAVPIMHPPHPLWLGLQQFGEQAQRSDGEDEFLSDEEFDPLAFEALCFFCARFHVRRNNPGPCCELCVECNAAPSAFEE